MKSKIVVIVSALIEWEAIIPLFPEAALQRSPFGEYFHAEVKLSSGEFPLTFFYGGWGKIAAAASAQYVIDHYQPDLLVNLGTCGGFEGHVDAGTTVLVERALSYDIYEQMGDAAAAIDFFTTELDLGWLPPVADLPVRRGILVSGDRDIDPNDIPMLIKRYNAFAGDWETASIAWVAQKNGSKLLVLRVVSDLINTEGGEVYGDKSLFSTRTRQLFPSLLDLFKTILSRWIENKGS